ncbi:MAG: hypothetical protein ACYCS7_14120 [Acidimicrobiales bacterium]
MMIITLTSVMVFNDVAQQTPTSTHDQSHEQALAAAEAGVDQYLLHLNQTPQYWIYNATNLPPGGDPALTGWEAVSAVSSPPTGSLQSESFTYTPDTSQISNNALYLNVTGRAGSVTRSVRVGFNEPSFADYVYFTNYEIFDPALGIDLSQVTDSNVTPQKNDTDAGSETNSDQSCQWVFTGTPPFTYECTPLSPDPDNDSGPTTAQQTATDYNAWCVLQAWQKNPGGTYGPDYNNESGQNPLTFPDGVGCPTTSSSGPVGPIYFGGGDVLNGPVDSNDEFHTCGNVTFDWLVSSAYNQSVGNGFGGPGAYFPFHSPMVAQFPNQGPDEQAIQNCGNPNPSFKNQQNIAAGGPVGQSVLPLPSQDPKIFADSQANGCSYNGSVNIALNGSTLTVTDAGGSSLNLGSGNTNTCTIGAPSISIPANGVIYVAGNANVSGTLTGALTIYSAQDLHITNNISYGDGAHGTKSHDVLGLEAAGNIVIDQNSNTCVNSGGNLNIDAAMLVLGHSFYVQNVFTSGQRCGTLTIHGSLAQNFRGVVALTGTSGYVKNYNWDSRLLYLNPPDFTKPVGVAWQRSTFQECRPATSVPPVSTGC